MVETTQAGKTLKLTWDNLNRLERSDNNGQVTTYGYDVFGRRLYKHSPIENSLTLFGWDGDLMIWESQQSSNEQAQYTKHYVYEPKSFVPLLQTGYTGFIKLLETPDYAQFQHEDYSVYKDPIWKTETRKNKAELEKVAFYHCDQVGTPQILSNELGECVWEIKQDTWGTTLEIKTTENLLEQTNIRFQGQYYDSETGLHYNRYRYYEPFSARYVSKDPIGLEGGLNNLAYVSDPNQWVDPMGLMGGKDNGLFWLTDSASEESNNQIKNMVQQSRNNPNNKTQLELIQSDAEKGRVLRAKTPAVSPTESQRNDFPVINNSRGSSNGGVLAKLLPNTMSPLAKDLQLAQDLKVQGAIRNNNLQAVAVAGYGAYAGAGSIELGAAATPVIGRAVAPVVKPIVNKIAPYMQSGAKLARAEGAGKAIGQSAAISSGIGGGMDVGMQMLECQCADINWKRTGGVAAVSGVVGGWGAGTSYAAEFGQVGWLGIARNSANAGQFIKNNASGLVIWGHEQVFGQLGTRAVKSVTDQKDEKKEK